MTITTFPIEAIIYTNYVINIYPEAGGPALRPWLAYATQWDLQRGMGSLRGLTRPRNDSERDK